MARQSSDKVTAQKYLLISTSISSLNNDLRRENAFSVCKKDSRAQCVAKFCIHFSTMSKSYNLRLSHYHWLFTNALQACSSVDVKFEFHSTSQQALHNPHETLEMELQSPQVRRSQQKQICFIKLLIYTQPMQHLRKNCKRSSYHTGIQIQR